MNDNIKERGSCYMYCFYRNDTGSPFYIGIGKKHKGWENCITHTQEFRRMYNLLARSEHFRRIIKKTEFYCEVLLESDNYDFIKQKEIEFIKLYGRKNHGGLLVNFTEGGDGNPELLISSEHRKMLSRLKSGGNNLMAKKVVRISDGKVFNSASEAFKTTSFNYDSFVYRVFGNKCKNDSGFLSLEDYENNNFDSIERGLKYININTKEKFKTLKEAYKSEECSICYTIFLKRFNSEYNTTHVVKIEDYYDGLKQNNHINKVCRQVENVLTGEVYNSITECVKKLNLKYSTLAMHLTGKNLNKRFSHLKYKN